MPEGDGGGDSQDKKLSNEIVWTLQRARVLFRHWTMPLLAEVRPPGTTQDDTISARGFALLVIIALTFAVRGDMAGGKVSFTLLAAAIAASLSAGLNILAQGMNITVREPALISAYASTILVMLGFLFVRAFLSDSDLYQAYFADYLPRGLAPTLGPIILSVLLVYLLLWLKSALWDKNKLSGTAAGVGFGITVGSGVIVCIIYYISNEFFEAIIRFFCRGSCGPL